MKNIIFCALFSIVATFNLFADEPLVVDKIVGIVGDNIVLKSDIEVQYQQFVLQGTTTPNMKCKILDDLLLEKLFLAQAIIDSVIVTEDEVESELERRIRYFTGLFGTKEKLEEYYGKSILELKEEFRADIHDQLLSEKMQRDVLSGLRVNPREVKTFFEAIPEDSVPYFNAEVQVAQIVMYPQVSQIQKDYALTKITEIREKIIEGDDFIFNAKFYSEDPGSAENGGDLGYIQRGEMVREFEAAAFRLKEGEISDIVETEYGYHILKAEEKKGEKVRIRHILISPKITSIETDAVKARFDSIKHQIVVDSLTFEKAVELFSEDDVSKLNSGLMTNPATGTSWFEMSEIEGGLSFTLETMEPGDISNVLPYATQTGRNGLRMVKLKSETEPHRASLREDYNKIQAAALQEKKRIALIDWVRNKTNETYIFVDQDYGTCGGINKWNTRN